MKVAVWSALGRLGSYSTGVGKHAMNMTCGLAGVPGWDVQLLLSSDLHAQESSRAECSRMDGIPDTRLPFSRRTLETFWRTTRRPALDRWLDGADWVYCPRELYVPVRRARYAVTVHDLFSLEPEFRRRSVRSVYRRRFLLERALHEADLILSVSEFTRHRLVDLVGVADEKVRVVGNGVEDRYFADGAGELREEVASEEQPYILSIGGVTRKKGAVNLLHAAAELARAAPRYTLVVVGPVEPAFESQVAAASNMRVMRRGFPDSEMHRLVRSAALLLILSEYEGFGIPALEAMAAGIPVIAADRAALPEVVGDAGILVDPRESEEVVEKALPLLHDTVIRSKLISRGRARVERYRWHACVKRLREALEEFNARTEKTVN